MESILQKPLGQYRKPSGPQGRAVIKAMNQKHYPLTTWGLSQVKFGPSDAILDIGCGGGRTLARRVRMAPKGIACGIDYSEDCVLWAERENRKAIDQGRAMILKSSVDALPFEKNTFDKAIAVETTYFWPDLVKNFAEVRRVLRPGGLFLIVNEAYTSGAFRERNEELEKVGKMKLLAPDEAKALLLKGGFAKAAVAVQKEKNWMCCCAKK